ncbi:hypothetical protein LEMLEM_LOCUS20410 [Lemmus lemmus]
MQSCRYLMTRSRTVRKPSAVSKSSMPLPCSQAYTRQDFMYPRH